MGRGGGGGGGGGGEEEEGEEQEGEEQEGEDTLLKDGLFLFLFPRTDSGVHALCSSALVDLEADQEYRSRHVGFGADGKRYFDPKSVTSVANKLFAEGEIPIRSVANDDDECSS